MTNPEAPTEVRLGLDGEIWLVGQLAAGATRDRMIAALVAEGLDAVLAAAQVDAVLASPSFAPLRQRMATATMVRQLVELHARLDPPGPVATAATIDRARFHRDHWRPARPLHLVDAARAMPAVTGWTIAGLAARFGDAQVEVNTGRVGKTRAALVERETTRLRLGDYLADLDRGGDDRYIVSRCGLLGEPALAPLWDDLTPVPEILDPPSRPRGVSLWIGPAGTHTRAHFDPHGVLLVQVQGHKRVRLVAPETLTIYDALDGYFAARPLDDLPAEHVRTVELAPGEALFVPPGMFHEVVALSPSITLSFLSFPWPNDFHWLRPA